MPWMCVCGFYFFTFYIKIVIVVRSFMIPGDSQTNEWNDNFSVNKCLCYTYVRKINEKSKVKCNYMWTEFNIIFLFYLFFFIWTLCTKKKPWIKTSNSTSWWFLINIKYIKWMPSLSVCVSVYKYCEENLWIRLQMTEYTECKLWANIFDYITSRYTTSHKETGKEAYKRVNMCKSNRVPRVCSKEMGINSINLKYLDLLPILIQTLLEMRAEI